MIYNQLLLNTGIPVTASLVSDRGVNKTAYMVYAIIAAGEGSRLANEGFTGLKPMARVNGEMLIDRLIRIFLQNDASSLVIIINDHSEELHLHLQSLSLPIPVKILVKSTPSSLHSFYELLAMDGNVPEALCLTTTDSVFDEKEFTAYITDFRNNRDNDGSLAVTSFIDDESPLYVHFDNAHLITAISDSSEVPDASVSGGIYCLRKKALLMVPMAIEQGISRMRNYQKSLLQNGLTLQAYPFSKIVDVDHVADIEKAETFLKENILTTETIRG